MSYFPVTLPVQHTQENNTNGLSVETMFSQILVAVQKSVRSVLK
jgi:mannose-1-phosphate guanylyltransferase